MIAMEVYGTVTVRHSIISYTYNSLLHMFFTLVFLTYTGNTMVTCTCQNDSDPCPGRIAASVLVPPILLALLIGGIVLIVVLVKRKQQAKVLVSSIGRRMQQRYHNSNYSVSFYYLLFCSWAVRFTRNPDTSLNRFENPTYNETVNPPTTPSTHSQLPLYETVFVLENHNAKVDEEMNYDVIREEYSNHNYDTVCDEDTYDTVSLGASAVVPMEVHSKPPLTPYAISSVDTKVPTSSNPPNKQANIRGNVVMSRVHSLQNSRHLPPAVSPKNGQAKIKKPVLKPKPNGLKVVPKSPLVKSASLSQMESYSQLTPRSKYAELEPHIPSAATPQQDGVKKANSVDRKPQSSKDEYSHLERK